MRTNWCPTDALGEAPLVLGYRPVVEVEHKVVYRRTPYDEPVPGTKWIPTTWRYGIHKWFINEG